MPVKVEVNVKALLHMRQRPQAALRALDVPLHATVRRALDFSQFLVPRQTPEEREESERARSRKAEGPPLPPLAETGFVSGPLHNLTDGISVTWTAGYEHPAAGPIHEGFHWDVQLFDPPPHFLKKSFRRTRGAARKGVAHALAAYLAKQFPSR